MKNKLLAVGNALSVIMVIVINYYSQSRGVNGKTVGELSDEYNNLFTPAGFAFSIWGIIFIMMIIYSVYQLASVFGNSSVDSYRRTSAEKTSFWFILANIGNVSWLFVWLNEWTGASVLVMLTILVSLLNIMLRTDLKVSGMSWKDRIFITWPIAVYAGWISVATIANFSAWLSKIGWEGGLLSEVQWTIVMISIAVVVNVFVIWKRNTHAFGMVGVWALFAIYARHQDSFTAVATSAIIGAGLIFVVNIYHLIVKRKAFSI